MDKGYNTENHLQFMYLMQDYMIKQLIKQLELNMDIILKQMKN